MLFRSRDGANTTVPRKDIVVGDIVVLNLGNEIPADGELLDAVTLSVDESTLTGEPHCLKTIDPKDFDPDATYPSNHVMRGTKVMEGHGVILVHPCHERSFSGTAMSDHQYIHMLKLKILLLYFYLSNRTQCRSIPVRLPIYNTWMNDMLDFCM